jgi:aryl-alcohol dehydrogenase-like predicted oxidoreductase
MENQAREYRICGSLALPRFCRASSPVGAERLSEELVLELAALKGEGKIRAAGFSTHHRELARAAITSAQGWDAIMIRHSAAHPGAEAELLPTARERGVGEMHALSPGWPSE